jgi:hypothetical protein
MHIPLVSTEGFFAYYLGMRKKTIDFFCASFFEKRIFYHKFLFFGKTIIKNEIKIKIHTKIATINSNMKR